MPEAGKLTGMVTFIIVLIIVGLIGSVVGAFVLLLLFRLTGLERGRRR